MTAPFPASHVLGDLPQTVRAMKIYVSNLKGKLIGKLMTVMFLVSALFVAHNPGLINERLKPGEGTEAWDKMHLSASTLLYSTTISLSTLDSGRAGLSPGSNPAACIREEIRTHGQTQ